MSLAFGSSAVYFIPGILGFSQFAYGRGLGGYSQPIVPGAYVSMAMVVVAVTAATLLIDRVPVRHQAHIGSEATIPTVLLAFLLVSGAVSVYNVGVHYLCLDKEIVLSRIGRSYNFTSLSVPFCIVTAYSLRQWWIVALGVICLCGDLYVGFRTTSAITFLALVMLTGHWGFTDWKRSAAFFAILILCGAGFVTIKHLNRSIKHATVSYCDAQIIRDHQIVLGRTANTADKAPAAPTGSDRGVEAREQFNAAAKNSFRPDYNFPVFVTQTEPFVIQAMLNEVVRKDFRTDGSYLIPQLLAGLPLATSLFGIDSGDLKTFNAMAQPVLFPRVLFGMANNPWAQAYAAGGQAMVAVFALCYALFAAMLTLLYHSTTRALKAGVAVIASWFCFYFHRNDLLFEVVLIKHVVYIFGASVLIAGTWEWMRTCWTTAALR